MLPSRSQLEIVSFQPERLAKPNARAGLRHQPVRVESEVAFEIDASALDTQCFIVETQVEVDVAAKAPTSNQARSDGRSAQATCGTAMATAVPTSKRFRMTSPFDQFESRVIRKIRLANTCAPGHRHAKYRHI